MSIKGKLIGNEDERAVSPVIGVILMVAITVILAAVIAAFVLDLGGSIGEEAQASVTIEGDGTSEATVAVTSLGNADGVYVTDGSGNYQGSEDVQDGLDGLEGLERTGASTTVEHNDPADDDWDSESFNVVAYIGGSPSDTETETVVASFELEGDD